MPVRLHWLALGLALLGVGAAFACDPSAWNEDMRLRLELLQGAGVAYFLFLAAAGRGQGIWRGRGRAAALVAVLSALGILAAGYPPLLMPPLAGLQARFTSFPPELAILGLSLLATEGGPRTPRERQGYLLGLAWVSASLLFPNPVPGHAWRLPLFDPLAPAPSRILGWIFAFWAGLGWWMGLRATGKLDVSVDHDPRWKWLGRGYYLVILGFATAPGNGYLALAASALALSVQFPAKAVLSDIRAGHAPLPPRTRWWIASRFLPAILLAVFFLLELEGLGPKDADENVYFYMLREWLRGHWPYRDFFFAHPPLHLALPALIFLPFGFRYEAAKWIAPVAALGAAFLFHRSVARLGGPLLALGALALFTTSSTILDGFSTFTGMESTVLWLWAGIYLSLTGRPTWAGVALGASLSTGVYAAAGIGAWLLCGCLRDARRGAAQALACLGVAGAVNGAFAALAGKRFWDGVYRYHFLKPFQTHPGAGGAGRILDLIANPEFRWEIVHQFELWSTAALALAWLARWRRPAGARAGWPDLAASTAAFGVQYAGFHELFGFYFLLIGGFLAALTAWIWVEVPRSWSGARPIPVSRKIVGLLALALCALGPVVRVGGLAGGPAPGEGGLTGIQGFRSHPAWEPGPWPWASRCLWAFLRIPPNWSESESAWATFLREQKSGFPEARDIGTWIRGNSRDGDRISGSATTAPLLSLFSGRDLALGEIDTNGKRFRSGMLDEGRFWSALGAASTRYLVVNWHGYFTPRLMDSLPAAREGYLPLKTFWGPTGSFSPTLPLTLYAARPR